jgi:hypothetical protein
MLKIPNKKIKSSTENRENRKVKKGRYSCRLLFAGCNGAWPDLSSACETFSGSFTFFRNQKSRHRIKKAGTCQIIAPQAGS